MKSLIESQISKAREVAALEATPLSPRQHKALQWFAHALFALSVAALIGAMTHRMALATKNERIAGARIIQLTLENSALRHALEVK